MPIVQVSNDDITVLGPPDIIDLQVNIGPQGTRGSKVFVGTGEPNLLTNNGIIFSQTLELNDLYINTSPGANYGYMYQYVSEPGANTWVQILKMNPTIFSKKHSTTYSGGVGQIIIPVSDIAIVSGTPLTANNFNIQFSIAHTNPVSASISLISISGDDLVIDFKAVENNAGTWQNLGSAVTTHLFISIVY